MDADTILLMRPLLTELARDFDDCFADHRSRPHLVTYLNGQLGSLKRKSIEPIADAAGVSPRTLQQFLGLTVWDDPLMRDRIQQRVARRHAHPGSIGIIDETSFPKKGRKTACVQRQHCGAMGKTENCVVSVHLGYAVPGLTEPSDEEHPFDSSDFHTLIDSDLYLPETTWDADPDRKQDASVPDDVGYEPMWKLALGQIDRAMANGVSFGYLTFDEAYAGRGPFLQGLDARGQRYIAEVPRSLHAWTRRPKVLTGPPAEGTARPGRPLKYPRLGANSARTRRVDEIAENCATLKKQPWITYLVKEGTKGPSVWEVKRICIYLSDADGLPTPPRHLIVARNATDPKEVKLFVSNAAMEIPMEELLTVAFSRWRIERMFEDAKDELGMDHFEVRSYLSIRRHLILSSLSHLFMAEFRQTARVREEAIEPEPGEEDEEECEKKRASPARR